MRRRAEVPGRGRRRGSVAILTALLLFLLFGFVAISVDTGYIIYVQNQLQASANMAAMAGSRYFTAGTASTAAAAYSGKAGGKNALPWQNVSVSVALPCLNAVKNLSGGGIACSIYGAQPSANAVQVTQTLTVSTFFAGLMGIPKVALTAMATAIPSGSSPLPLNVAIILDTTASMNSNDTSCKASRLQCALNGVQVLLGQLLPSVDQVSLLVFPGLTNVSQAAYNFDCKANTTPQIAAYSANPVYSVISSSTDYRTGSPPASGLSSTSNLAKAVGAGGSGCTGLQAVGGVGTYYADAITEAQTGLAASQKTGQQNVIILLSDGDASSSQVAAGKAKNQCHAAIAAANTAAKAGTWVYAIAYGASTSNTGSCSTDQTHISACQSLQQIASDPAKFYSDAPSSCYSVNSQSSLNNIFSGIAGSFSKARLIPNGLS
jgi:Flp pilus assembly protein TadG